MSAFANKHACLSLLLSLLLALPYTVNAVEPGGKVLYTIDFSQQPDGSAIDWLKQNEFILELDAEKLNPRFENHRLVISTEDSLAGIFGIKTDTKNISNVESVQIEWGVSKFPEGAEWEKGNNRVAVAMMIFFGTEKLSSGLPFGINSAPYFFSPFVSKADPPGKMYLGKLYKMGGRYFSIAPPESSSEIFITDFEVRQRFITIFEKKEVPAVSGVAFQMNTQDTQGGAVAAIRKVLFLGRGATN